MQRTATGPLSALGPISAIPWQITVGVPVGEIRNVNVTENFSRTTACPWRIPATILGLRRIDELEFIFLKMKDALEFGLVVCVAILVLGVVKLLNHANKRLLATGQLANGRIKPRRSFPLIPTNDSEVERNRPGLWLWALVDLFLIVIVLIWFLATRR